MSSSLASQHESATRGTIFLSAGHASLLVSNAVIHIVAGRTLLTEAYGRFVIVFFVLSWINAIIASIILPGLKRIVSEEARRFYVALSFAVKWYSLAALGLTVLFCCSPQAASRVLGDPKLTVLFFLAGLQVPFLAALNLGWVLLSALRRFLRASLLKISYAFSCALVSCTLLRFGFGAPGAVGGLLAGALSIGIVSVVLLLKERRRIPSVSYPPISWRVLYWTSLVLPANVGIRTLMILDIWLVKGMMEDPEAAGVYGVAYSLSRLPMFIVHGLGGAIFPRVSNALEKKNIGLARSVSAEAMRFLMVLFVPICFITASCSSEIIDLLYSARYVEASRSLIVLVPAIFFAGQILLALQLLLAAGRPGRCLVVIFGLLLSALLCNVVLISRLGILGAALACLIVFGIGVVVVTFLVYRLLRVGPPVWTALRCCLGGGVVYVLGRAWPASGALLFGKLFVLCLLYLTLLFLLRVLRKDDIFRIKHSILT